MSSTCRSASIAGLAGYASRYRTVETLRELELLGSDVNYVRANLLTDDEYGLIAASGGSISPCPSVDMLMGIGTYPATGRALDRRPRLRLRQTPAAPPPARDQTADRPSQHHARLRARRHPLCRRAHLRPPVTVQTTARPLGTPRRDARSDARDRLLPPLLPPARQTHSAMSS